MSWLAWLRCAFDPYANLITALATFLIAIFTVVLACLARTQARIFRHQTRAFVFIESVVPTISLYSDNPSHREDPLPGIPRPELYLTYFSMQPKWKNAGNTPTKKMKVRFNRRFFEDGVVPPDYDFGKELPDMGERNFFLGPHAVEGGEVITTNPSQLNAIINNGDMRVDGKEPIMLVFGRSDYQDIFGHHHFVRWCYRLRFFQPASEKGIERLQVSFIQYGDYNGTDEDK
jgi:hypothetical protein